MTTEPEKQARRARDFTNALIESGYNYVVISPNNDAGSEQILKAYEALEGNPRIRRFPSMRFEYFLRLMQGARFIIGNSSAGVREAPIYGVRTINVGSRQRDRFQHPSIANVPSKREPLLAAMREAWSLEECPPCFYFGRGDSVGKFMAHLAEPSLWNRTRQKHFQDMAQG